MIGGFQQTKVGLCVTSSAYHVIKMHIIVICMYGYQISVWGPTTFHAVQITIAKALIMLQFMDGMTIILVAMW
jgi:hypothetical protein